jgi:colanic acid biosynthesis glycosyl transferase WcaI
MDVTTLDPEAVLSARAGERSGAATDGPIDAPADSVEADDRAGSTTERQQDGSATNRQQDATGRKRDTTAGAVDGRSAAAGRSVVFVSQQYPPDRSGHASRIRDTATALADEGWDVTVLAAPASFPPGAFDRRWRPVATTVEDGVTVRRLWTWQPTEPDPGFLTRLCYYVVFALFATLWVAFTHRRHDVVVTTTPPISTGLAGFPAALLGRRWVVDVRDLWIDASVSLGFIAEGGLLERASRRFQRAALRTADSVSVTTATLGESLSEQYGSHLAAKTVLVPNGVDVAGFRERVDGGTSADASTTDPDTGGDEPDIGAGSGTEPDARDDRTGTTPASTAKTTASGGESTASTGRFEVVYTGNIGHAQALDTCVRALGHLPDRAVLRLVGGGDAVPALRALAHERGVADRVEFEGTVSHDRIPAILRTADVGVAPLEDDPELAYAMPTKVYEYLCARLPMVVTGRGELERFVRESGGGIHAEPDPESVASAVTRLLEDPELRATLGRQGHEHVRRQYDRTAIAARFSDHLHGLVDGTSGPAEDPGGRGVAE